MFELSVKLFVLEELKSRETLYKLSRLIDTTLSKDKNFINFHNENEYKNYVFDSLYPLEKTKIYKKDKIYMFRIRTVDENLVSFLMDNLVNEYTKYFKVLTITKKVIPKKIIESVYSLTPLVLKFDCGYWKNENTLEDVKKRITENIIKKYNSYEKTKVNEEFELFTTIKIKNEKPFSSKYKNISILGDKFEFEVSENEIAQKIIYFSLGTGLGEMNARGFGFINYRWK